MSRPTASCSSPGSASDSTPATHKEFTIRCSDFAAEDWIRTLLLGRGCVLGAAMTVQIGLVVLVGLASKNAILIVEFAKQLEDRGMDRFEAALEAAKPRLRPILMTAFSFILGVVPLMFASGAGAEMRRALGTTVFSGMLGVTLFGLILTPVFYVLCRKLGAVVAEKIAAKKIENI